MLIGGSRIVLTARGPLRLHSRDPERGYPTLELADRRVPVRVPGNVYDLHVAGDRVFVIVDETLASTDLALADVHYEPGPVMVSRVAATDATVFIASSREVTTRRGTRIHPCPLDIATSATELAVLDANGITFYDARGFLLRDLPLFAPTALAADHASGGWLAAVDGGVVQIAGPHVRLIAPVEERVYKVRRAVDGGVYVLVRNELRLIDGDRLTHVTAFPYDTGDWDDFDAGPTGFARYRR